WGWRGVAGAGGGGCDLGGSGVGGGGSGLIADRAGGGAVSATAAATGLGSTASGSAAPAGTAGATPAIGLGAGDATRKGAGALLVPALTATVLTSTGWIGSVEPMTTRACVSVATGSGGAPSRAAPAELKRTGMLIALATANRGSTFAFGCAVASVLVAT